jgi:hypothetical protein
MREPLFSIDVPTYRRPKFLVCTLASMETGIHS